MPSTFSCTLCTKSFGKHEKLQRHLLTDHHGELRLSPGRAADCEAIGDVLAKAVDTANAAFADLPVGSVCPCVICGDSCKPFRNAMDLAQHLVAKHDGRAGDASGDGEEGKLKKGGAQSEVSASGNGKRGKGTGRGRGRGRDGEGERGGANISGNEKESGSEKTGEEGTKVLGKRKAGAELDGFSKTAKVITHNETDASVKGVREKMNDGTGANGTGGALQRDSVAGNFGKSTATIVAGKSSTVRAIPESDGKTAEVKRRMSAPAELMASGTKPPVTPKKKAGQNIEWMESHGIRLPKQAAMRATTLDFSYFGGFSAYSHKSYYRLVDR